MDTEQNPEPARTAGRHRVVDTPVIQPFLRWTGGKKRLVPEILKWAPPQRRAFHEPFMGSAALFFALRPLCQTFLCDANTNLTRTFGAVQSDVDEVIARLKIYADMYTKHGEVFYYHVRDGWSEDMESPDLAATFIFLNKTNFNGIWRVNAKGEYNVPAGKFNNPPTVCDEPRLRACSEALRNATIINCDFRTVETRAVAGDWVYFDPPYVPTSSTSEFTAYTAGGFDDNAQIALRDLALRLKRKGVYVTLSNSDAPRVRELYAGPGWEIREITRAGGMNSDSTKRQAVAELLIR